MITSDRCSASIHHGPNLAGVGLSRSPTGRSAHWPFGALILGLFLTVAAPTAVAQAATLPAHQSKEGIQLELSTAIPVSSLPTWPILRKGSSSLPVTVRSLQYLLNAHGAGLQVDGIFGPRTNAAVRAFQRANGLVVDGVVGPRTWSAVIVTVRRGSVGPAVKAVQDQANARVGASGRSKPGLVVDGIFGARTDQWVYDFQAAIAGHVIGYPVDGIVGPLTWSLLVSGEQPQ